MDGGSEWLLGCRAKQRDRYQVRGVSHRAVAGVLRNGPSAHPYIIPVAKCQSPPVASFAPSRGPSEGVRSREEFYFFLGFRIRHFTSVVRWGRALGRASRCSAFSRSWDAPSTILRLLCRSPLGAFFSSDRAALNALQIKRLRRPPVKARA